MEARTLLQTQFKLAHDIFNQVVADVPAEMLAQKPAGTILPIAAIAAHCVMSEDYFFNVLAAEGKGLYEDFLARLGLELPSDGNLHKRFAAPIAEHADEFRDYAKRVFASADRLLVDLSDAQLDRQIDGFLGKTTVIGFLGDIGLYHLAGHTSEIAALKGVNGLKGLPF